MEPTVRGPAVDEQTRCVHYRTPLDIVSIRFPCCADYYPCHLCHHVTADHPSRPWPMGSDHELAVLCGACHTTLSIGQYRGVDACPHCAAPFNPQCRLHHPIYFD